MDLKGEVEVSLWELLAPIAKQIILAGAPHQQVGNTEGRGGAAADVDDVASDADNCRRKL